MDPKLQSKLKQLSKDDESFKIIKGIYSQLEKQQNYLKLLERATSNDYDSILVTELNLEAPGPKIVYVNKGFCDITGYSRDEVIGKTPRILQGPKTDKVVLQQLKERLQNGRAFFGQAINYRKDGSEFVNQWDIHPLTDEEGNITHWVSYQHDITERKRAEKKVLSHVGFDELSEKAKCTTLDVNTSGDIISTNKSFRNLIGYVKDELEGTKVWELFPQKYRNSLKARFDKPFDENDFKNRKFQGIIKHKHGLPIQVEGNTSVLTLKDQTIIRAEVKNISMQKRVMEALQKKNKNYEKVVEQATEFNYKISLEEGKPVIEYVSEGFSTITGVPSKDVIHAEGLQAFVHEQDIDKVTKHLQKVMAGKSCTCEYRILTNDGSYRDVIDYARSGTCIKGGETKCVRGSIIFKAKKAPLTNKV